MYEELRKKLCPFLVEQKSVCEGRYRDNIETYSSFAPCIEEKCMAWDTEKKQCRRLYNDGFMR